ncbi:hypothetical protein B0H34DRAFT_675846 [Crassisporium funariophilum]|nr:hypothetical protein B0H34DRAFT_675846 [Crassisporium funariophilum]
MGIHTSYLLRASRSWSRGGLWGCYVSARLKIGVVFGTRDWDWDWDWDCVNSSGGTGRGRSHRLAKYGHGRAAVDNGRKCLLLQQGILTPFRERTSFKQVPSTPLLQIPWPGSSGKPKPKQPASRPEVEGRRVESGGRLVEGRERKRHRVDYLKEPGGLAVGKAMYESCGSESTCPGSKPKPRPRQARTSQDRPGQARSQRDDKQARGRQVPDGKRTAKRTRREYDDVDVGKAGRMGAKVTPKTKSGSVPADEQVWNDGSCFLGEG